MRLLGGSTMNLLKYAAVAAIANGALSISAAQATETKGPVTDEVGVVEIQKGQPVVLGAYLAVGGSESAPGFGEKRAIEIALGEVEWKIAGHPVTFNAEDSLCNSEGGQNALMTPDMITAVGNAVVVYMERRRRFGGPVFCSGLVWRPRFA